MDGVRLCVCASMRARFMYILRILNSHFCCFSWFFLLLPLSLLSSLYFLFVSLSPFLQGIFSFVPSLFPLILLIDSKFISCFYTLNQKWHTHGTVAKFPLTRLIIVVLHIWFDYLIHFLLTSKIDFWQSQIKMKCESEKQLINLQIYERNERDAIN